MEATRSPPCLPVPPLTPKRVVATGPRSAESRNRHWTPQCLFLLLPASGRAIDRVNGRAIDRVIGPAIDRAGDRAIDRVIYREIDRAIDPVVDRAIAE